MHNIGAHRFAGKRSASFPSMAMAGGLITASSGGDWAAHLQKKIGPNLVSRGAWGTAETTSQPARYTAAHSTASMKALGMGPP